MPFALRVLPQLRSLRVAFWHRFSSCAGFCSVSAATDVLSALLPSECRSILRRGGKCANESVFRSASASSDRKSINLIAIAENQWQHETVGVDGPRHSESDFDFRPNHSRTQISTDIMLITSE